MEHSKIGLLIIGIIVTFQVQGASTLDETSVTTDHAVSSLADGLAVSSTVTHQSDSDLSTTETKLKATTSDGHSYDTSISVSPPEVLPSITPPVPSLAPQDGSTTNSPEDTSNTTESPELLSSKQPDVSTVPPNETTSPSNTTSNATDADDSIAVPEGLSSADAAGIAIAILIASGLLIGLAYWGFKYYKEANSPPEPGASRFYTENNEPDSSERQFELQMNRRSP